MERKKPRMWKEYIKAWLCHRVELPGKMASEEAKGGAMAWEWSSDDLQWTRYSPSCSAAIEAAYLSGLSALRIQLGNSSYHVFFRPLGLRQRNVLTGRIRHVRRQIMQGNGVTWQWHDNDKLHWHDYDAGLASQLEAKWAECKLSKLENEEHGPAGLTLTINGFAYAIEFESDAVQCNVRTHYTRGIRRVTNSMTNNDKVELNMPSGSVKPECGSSSLDTRIQLPLPHDASQLPCSSVFSSSVVVESKHDSADTYFSDESWFRDYLTPPKSEDCSICLSSLAESKALLLTKCGHSFHRGCIELWFKNRPSCPECLTIYGIITGSQPPGEMDVQYLAFGTPAARNGLAGYPHTDVIKITYKFPSGIQTAEHPNPGRPYGGTVRIAYLPRNKDGEEILELLRRAFHRRLLFRVGTSITTGRSDIVVWAGIHHKTQMGGGSSNHGYPDDTYFSRVKDELADVGVTSSKRLQQMKESK